MHEKVIIINSKTPVLFFGSRHKYIHYIQKLVNNVKIVARGNEIKLNGDFEAVENIYEKLNTLLNHFYKTQEMNEFIIEETILNNNSSLEIPSSEVIIYNNHGKAIKAHTINQQKLVQLSQQNDLIFVTGPAGSGKTYTAIALAVKALKYREIRRIILSRPAVEAGENLGYLPGNLKDKLDPYLQPLYDALLDMIPKKKLEEYIEEGVIEIAPLAYMRGRTLDNAFVILDEAQNATILQLKMFLTRMGRNAKFIITGDITQIDLNRNQTSGLIHALSILKGIEGIGFIEFNNNDIVRHHLVKKIVTAYNKWQNKKNNENNENNY